MLWSIDTCQNKVSADQYHVTISQAQVRSYRGELSFFFKLTADPGLVVDWIAGSSQVRHSHSHLLFLWLDAATQPCYVSKALDSLCFSCSGTVWKIYIFCIFAGFNPGFT